MAVVEAELKRRDATLALVDWLLSDDTANTATGKSDPVIDYGARARLVEIRDALLAGVTVDTGLLQGLTLAELVALLPLPVDAGTVTVTGTQIDGLTDAQLRATPVPVDTRLPLDIFGRLVVASMHNQIETSFFAAAPTALDTITVTTSGGGSTALHDGHGHFITGTGANGKAAAQTVDTIRYRPEAEVYGAFTANFTVPTSVNSSQRIGLFNATEGFFLGYEGLTLGVAHRTLGVDTFIPRSSWDDPLTGGAGSTFTLDGSPVTLDPTKINVFRIRYGWLGVAPVIFEVLAPDGHWTEFHRFTFANAVDHTSTSTPDLPLRVEVYKTGADGTSLSMSIGCWAAGTTADVQALDESISDRSLASLTRSVITAKNPSGSYVQISANTQGKLQVAADVTAESAFPVTDDGGSLTVDGPLTDLELRATPVPVSDDFPAGEILADQTGAGAVLTFTFSADVQTVWVYAVDPSDLTSTGEVRVDPFGGVPSASLGIPVAFGGGFPIPAVTSTVAVFATSGTRVTVYGNRR